MHFFEIIRRINGVDHETYGEPCYALGLLDDNKKWNDYLAETAQWASGNELQNLFITILNHCQIFNSRKLWKITIQFIIRYHIDAKRRD